MTLDCDACKRRRRDAKSTCPDMPFRPFYVLAALDSIVAVGLWIPRLAGWGELAIVESVATWHARELLFGAFPAALTGFLLTALPRWTGRPIAPPRLGLWLLLLWFAGPASLFLAPALRPAMAAGFLAVLLAAVARHVVASGDRRNVKIILLVALLGIAAVLDQAAGQGDPGLPIRLAVGAILGLVMVLGGRIVPSISAAVLDRQGRPVLPPPRLRLEQAAAAAAIVALAGWIWSPESTATAIAAAAAAATQMARWLRWRPWRVAAAPTLLAFHAAYACIPLGFALSAVRAIAPGAGLHDAGLHVWAIGAIGLMCVSVMSSMIRRHAGSPLTPSASFNLVLLMMGAALAARAVGAVIAGRQEWWLLAGAIAWVAAHALFFAIFARPLLVGLPRHR